MTTQQPTWGTPAPQRPRGPWSIGRVVVTAVLAVAIVGGATAAVLTATSSAATTEQFGPGGGAGGGPGLGGGFGRQGAGASAGVAGLTDALHGDFVVARGTGYGTDRLQTGTVTAASATDLTVRSTDGYTQRYVVGAGTSIGTVATGNTVTVVATVSGQTATATTIEDTGIGNRTGRGGTGQGGTPPGAAPPGN